MSPKHNHSWVVVLHTIADARGEPGYSPILLSCYVTPSASFIRLVSPLTTPTPSYQPPPYLRRPPSLPPYTAPPYSPPLGLGLDRTDPTTVVTSMILAAIPPLEIARVSDKS